MQFDKILVVTKLSKYQYDLHSIKLTHDELMSKYTHESVDIDRVMASHQRQSDNLSHFKKIFPEAKIISGLQLNMEDILQSDLIIAFGGDNHFQYVTHYVESTPIMGINSDPLTSEGVLTTGKPNEFELLKEAISRQTLKIEHWTRLQAEINGVKTRKAICDYYLGERNRTYMSRYFVQIGDRKEQQKSSGLLLATGAGSTGWYRSASRFLHPDGDNFPPHAEYFKTLTLEPYKGKLTSYSINNEIISDGDIMIYSLNDYDGILSVDSLEEYPFPRGSVAKIWRSASKLNVVVDF